MADTTDKAHPKNERTLLLIKPDGVRRGLVGEIISRLENRGLKIIALSMIKPPQEQIDKHYPTDEGWLNKVGEKTLGTYKEYGWDAQEELGTEDTKEIGQMVRKWNEDYLLSGPMVRMIIEGVHARTMVRKLVGATFPSAAELGSIRGDFSVDSPTTANRDKRAVRNLVHASETLEEFENEFALWFEGAELYDYERSDDGIAF